MGVLDEVTSVNCRLIGRMFFIWRDGSSYLENKKWSFNLKNKNEVCLV